MSRRLIARCNSAPTARERLVDCRRRCPGRCAGAGVDRPTEVDRGALAGLLGDWGGANLGVIASGVVLAAGGLGSVMGPDGPGVGLAAARHRDAIRYGREPGTDLRPARGPQQAQHRLHDLRLPRRQYGVLARNARVNPLRVARGVRAYGVARRARSGPAPDPLSTYHRRPSRCPAAELARRPPRTTTSSRRKSSGGEDGLPRPGDSRSR
jgi:hypothetical protein